jgi:hypothetical protein
VRRPQCLRPYRSFGNRREDHGHGEDEERHRHHHPDLTPAGGLEEGPLAGLPHVDGLRSHHVREWRASFDGERDAIDEPGEGCQRRPAGDALQGLHQ